MIQADEKTEAVLITNCSKNKKKNTMMVEVGGYMVDCKPVGVIIHGKPSSREKRLGYSCQKVADAATVFARILPNVGGPKH